MGTKHQKIERRDDFAEPNDVHTTTSNDADFDNYLADMILDLQQMAARSGRHALAERLLAAHELARHR